MRTGWRKGAASAALFLLLLTAWIPSWANMVDTGTNDFIFYTYPLGATGSSTIYWSTDMNEAGKTGIALEYAYNPGGFQNGYQQVGSCTVSGSFVYCPGTYVNDGQTRNTTSPEAGVHHKVCSDDMTQHVFMPSGGLYTTNEICAPAAAPSGPADSGAGSGASSGPAASGAGSGNPPAGSGAPSGPASSGDPGSGGPGSGGSGGGTGGGSGGSAGSGSGSGSGGGTCDPATSSCGTCTTGGCGSATDSRKCDVEPTCTGDAIQCSILKQSYDEMCVLTAPSTPEQDAVLQADIQHEADNYAGAKQQLDSSASSVFSDFVARASGNAYPGSCVPDTQFTVMGHTLAVPWHLICAPLGYLRLFVVAFAYFVAARIIYARL
jgi:hypothetical protein